MLIKASIETQFSYCPLILMFYRRVAHRKLIHLREHSLRIVYRSNTSSFHEFLQKEHYCTVYHKGIQSLSADEYNVRENLSSQIMNSIF